MNEIIIYDDNFTISSQQGRQNTHELTLPLHFRFRSLASRGLLLLVVLLVEIEQWWQL